MDELKAEENKDLWGLGYRVIMHKLGAQSTRAIMDAPHMAAIVDALFPTHPVNAHELRPVAADDVLLINDEELKEAQA